MNKLTSKVAFVYSWSVRPRRGSLLYNWLKTGTFHADISKIYFFYQQSQPPYDVMHKEIEVFEFVQGVNFELTDSLENNGTKKLLIFDDSCQEFWISESICWYYNCWKTSWIEYYLH